MTALYRPSPTDPWANFWKRMRDVPVGVLVRETAPPAQATAKERPAQIPPEVLAACIAESNQYNRAASRRDNTRRAERATRKTASSDITTRATATAERILGINNHHESRTT